jgi:DNA-binding response OmpR family regulator
MSTAQDTILIVEDEAYIARLLEVYLTERGFAVKIATRGSEALAICHSTPPDLILLDVRLPDMSGYDVGLQLRSSPDTQNIPIVVLTAYQERNDRMIAHDVVHADYFLGKPFDIEEVHAVIRNQLNEKRQRNHYHPITNLATGDLVNQQLRELLTRSDWTLALIRINGFESFTQFYGVVVGENVLKFTALLLSDVMHTKGATEDFMGQLVVGPYFLVISTAERIEAIANDLISRFDEDIQMHYDYRDRQDGRVPPLSLAIGVLSSTADSFGDIRELTETAEALLQPGHQAGRSRIARST